MPAASQVGPSEKRGTGGGWGAPGWRAMPATGGANGMWRQHSGEGTYGVNARSPRGSLHSLQERKAPAAVAASAWAARQGGVPDSQSDERGRRRGGGGWNAGRRLGREDGRGGERRGREAKGMGRGAEPSDVRRGPRTDDERKKRPLFSSI